MVPEKDSLHANDWTIASSHMMRTEKESTMNSPERKLTRKTLLKGAAVAGAAIALKSVFAPVLRAFAKMPASKRAQTGQ